MLDLVDVHSELLTCVENMDENLNSLIYDINRILNYVPNVKNHITRNEIDAALDLYYALLNQVTELSESLDQATAQIIDDFRSIDAIYDKSYQ